MTNLDDNNAWIDVRDFARQAAASTGEIPLPVLQDAIDAADGELGQRLLLSPGERPEGTEDLMHDLRLVRALQRYRLALDGIAA